MPSVIAFAFSTCSAASNKYPKNSPRWVNLFMEALFLDSVFSKPYYPASKASFCLNSCPKVSERQICGSLLVPPRRDEDRRDLLRRAVGLAQPGRCRIPRINKKTTSSG